MLRIASRSLITKAVAVHLNNPDDADIAVDRILGYFQERLRQLFSDIYARLMPTRFENMRKQDYDFISRGSGQSHTIVQGQIKYPSKVIAEFAWKLKILDRWNEAVKKEILPYARPGHEHTPVVIKLDWLVDTIVDVADRAVSKPAYPQIRERLIDSMYSSGKVDDDSTTEYYNFQGVQEETREGYSADITFYPEQETPLIQVSVQDAYAIVKFSVPFHVHSKIESPWGR
jgi:hypothetical protein